ncbi:hypothetical protein EJ04DRAFT_564950 [Polyplosphaeria fusca]|uniref:Gag protein n=1 Tax=Polyplosphaeria fusca TaxID=682080 RepID=A0A9P4QVP0_9PLEO|nr:hypothetical protein EJ04DRAFT_564950 [Polyplosphaeria fusca]
MNLAKDGKNILLWEAALRNQIVGKAAEDILEEASVPPKPSKPIYQDLPPRPDDTEPQAVSLTWQSQFDTVRRTNEAYEAQYNRQQKDYRDHIEKEAFVMSILLATVHQETLEGLRSHKTAGALFVAILKHYKDQGLTEECTLWANFFSLRSAHCDSTAQFTSKFKAGLARLDDIDLKSSPKGVVFQFVVAIEDQFKTYAQQQRQILRQGRVPDIDAMINEINDEARREDPVKKAMALRVQPKSTQQPGSNQRQGKGDKVKKDNKPRNTKPTSSKPVERRYCPSCQYEHLGGGPNCWFAYPEKASKQFLDKHPKLVQKAAKSTQSNDIPSANFGVAATTSVPSSYNAQVSPTSRHTIE